MRRSNGESIWISLTAEPIHDDSGHVMASRSVALDVTSRRVAEDALRDSEEQFRRMFEDAPTGMTIVRPDGTLLAANDALATSLGYGTGDLVGHRLLDFVHSEDRTAARHEISTVRAGASRVRGVELRVLTSGGSVRHALVTLSLLRLGDPGPCVLAHLQDVTERRKVEEELRLLALHDPLTGLYNRRGLEVAASQRADDDDASLLFIDVDDLKRINDGHGHAAGDAALVAIAGILREATGDHHIAARIGGDEFCVLVPGAASNSDAVLHDIRLRVETFNRETFAPYDISLSIGVSHRPWPVSIDALFPRADQAMYAAKQDGRRNLAEPSPTPAR